MATSLKGIIMKLDDRRDGISKVTTPLLKNSIDKKLSWDESEILEKSHQNEEVCYVGIYSGAGFPLMVKWSFLRP